MANIYEKLPTETIEQYFARLPGSKQGSVVTGAPRQGIDTPINNQSSAGTSRQNNGAVITSEPARVSYQNNVATLPRYEAPLVSGSAPFTIQPGNTLSQIARDQGTTVQEILKLNPDIKNPDVIQAGASLNLPKAQGALTVRSTNPALQSLITQANSLIQKAGNLTPENQNLLNTINGLEMDKTSAVAGAREAADKKEASTLSSRMKEIRDIETTQREALNNLFTELRSSRADILKSFTPTEKERELQTKLNTLRTERQLLPIELRQEGISAQGIASRQVEDERVRAIQESNLLTELGFEQDARKLKADMLEKNYSFISEDIELQNKVIEKLAEQEKTILDEAKNMNKDQLTSLKSILDSFEGLEWADLDATAQSQLSEIATNSNIPVELLASALKNAKQQAIVSKTKSTTAPKVDTITVDERRRLYPSLPSSLIGQDEKEVLSQLESSEIPNWYRELKRGGQQATPIITQEEWDAFRTAALESMRGQVQKNPAVTDEEI